MAHLFLRYNETPFSVAFHETACSKANNLRSPHRTAPCLYLKNGLNHVTVICLKNVAFHFYLNNLKQLDNFL